MYALSAFAPTAPRHAAWMLTILLAMLGGLPSGPAKAATAGCETVSKTADPGPARPAARAPAADKSAPPRAAMRPAGSDHPVSLALTEGKSVLRQFDWPVARYAVGDPCIADAMLVNPQQLYLLGKRPGTTNIILWNKQGEATILDLTVGVDTAALQASYAMLPDKAGEAIRITPAGDTLIVSGTVADAVQVDQVLALANAHLQRGARAQGGGGGAGGNGEGQSAPKVINMLAVAAPQQVMLEVKVAEVSKTLVDQLGASLGASRTIGSWTYTLLSNLLSNNPSVGDAFNNRNGNFLTLDAQKRNGLIKVLAEPTIMAISGQEASFLAGGKIFIPVAQNNNGGTTTITLEEKEFGVAVKFTPTVLAGGRINLKVAPEVSDLNKEGVGISATGISTTAILPSFTTRRATTTVQLFDGQSFAIGGLIKNNVTTNVKAFPVLGEVPVLGALFRSSDFQTDRSELVFIVTPRLVKPLPADYRLPTDGYIEPSRSEFFLQGKLEGKAAAAPATPPGQGSGGFDLK